MNVTNKEDILKVKGKVETKAHDSLYYQLDGTYNHLGDTPLGMTLTEFPETFSLGRKPYSECGQHQAWGPE